MSLIDSSAAPAHVLCVLLAAGCGSSAARPVEKPAAPVSVSDVSRYMPLKHDTVYAYETSVDDSGESGVLVMQISRPRPDMAELTVGGRAQRLDIASDGIRHATGGYLLKRPLSVGARYKGQFGDVTVTQLDKSIQVPAGSFVGCIETIEEATAPTAKKVTTVFCPDVGMVLLIAEGMIGNDYASERAVLRSFGPRVDLAAMPENER